MQHSWRKSDRYNITGPVVPDGFEDQYLSSLASRDHVDCGNEVLEYAISASSIAAQFRIVGFTGWWSNNRGDPMPRNLSHQQISGEEPLAFLVSTLYGIYLS